MQKRTRITPEEKQHIIDEFNALPEDTLSRYATIAKKFKRSTSTVFELIKATKKVEPKEKYFNPKIFQF